MMLFISTEKLRDNGVQVLFRKVKNLENKVEPSVIATVSINGFFCAVTQMRYRGNDEAKNNEGNDKIQ